MFLPCSHAFPVLPILDLVHPSVDEYHSKLSNLGVWEIGTVTSPFGIMICQMPFISSQISNTYIYIYIWTWEFSWNFRGVPPVCLPFCCYLLGEIWPRPWIGSRPAVDLHRDFQVTAFSIVTSKLSAANGPVIKASFSNPRTFWWGGFVNRGLAKTCWKATGQYLRFGTPYEVKIHCCDIHASRDEEKHGTKTSSIHRLAFVNHAI